jgi:DNA-binding CsgD family transcriptional regulator
MVAQSPMKKSRRSISSRPRKRCQPLQPSETRIYDEQALVRKMRNELARLPEVREEQVPNDVIEYLIERHIEQKLDSARLSPREYVICGLHLLGCSPGEIASLLHLSRQHTRRLLKRALFKVAKRRKKSKYDGLYEVYWQEVNRTVYRPRRCRMMG